MFEKYIQVPIIPVATVNNADEIRVIADLAMEYLPAIEVTLRTDFAYKALEILATDYPDLPRAAATILNREQIDNVRSMETNIVISAGFQVDLLEYGQNNDFHYIPGVSSPAEIEQCHGYGYRHLKFFPASLYGGVSWLRTMACVYQHTDIQFMPLGGVNMSNAREYLLEPNVFACGGSWLCPSDLLQQKNWAEITKLFQNAHQLIQKLQ